MEKILFLFAFLYNIAIVQAQVQPGIQFKKTTHDYGTLKEEKGEVKAEFTFKNTGNLPLIIENVYPSCGCTTAKYTKTPVLPGEKGTIEAVYHTKNNTGHFHKSILVYSNDPVNKMITLYIDGSVKPRVKTIADDYPYTIGNLSLKSNHIGFNSIKNTEIKTDTLWLFNAGKKKLNIEFLNNHNWLSTSKNKIQLKPKMRSYVLITYNAGKRNEWGLNFDRFIMKTNDDTLAEKNIYISAQIEEDFSQLTTEQLKDAPRIFFDNIFYEFGEIKQGVNIHHDFIFKNTGKSDLIIRNIKTSCGCTKATIENTIVKAGESGRIAAVLYSEEQFGEQQKTITVITNDPDHSTIILSLTGVVNK